MSFLSVLSSLLAPLQQEIYTQLHRRRDAHRHAGHRLPDQQFYESFGWNPLRLIMTHR